MCMISSANNTTLNKNGHSRHASLDNGSSKSNNAGKAELQYGGHEDLHFRWRGLQNSPTLHFLLKIHTHDLDGQCCIPLPMQAFQVGETLTLTEQLTRNGLPVRDPRLEQKIVKVELKLKLKLKPISQIRRQRKINHSHH